jgi:gliding motility-associated lipoprotein GldD
MLAGKIFYCPVGLIYLIKGVLLRYHIAINLFMRFSIVFFVTVFIVFGCKEKFTPKPRGFFRIAFPEKKYDSISTRFPYRFEIPEYTVVQPDSRNPNEPWWINIEFPENKAEVHISYYNLQDNKGEGRKLLAGLMEETRELAYKHSIKANSIEEQLYLNPDTKVYGTFYRILGNAASPMQFFLTDSTRHFLRGALYIKAAPDIDSLKPVVDFLERDVIHLIETTQWQ